MKTRSHESGSGASTSKCEAADFLAAGACPLINPSSQLRSRPSCLEQHHSPIVTSDYHGFYFSNNVQIDLLAVPPGHKTQVTKYSPETGLLAIKPFLKSLRLGALAYGLAALLDSFTHSLTRNALRRGYLLDRHCAKCVLPKRVEVVAT